MKKSRIIELEKLIAYHKERYYGGHAEISDEAFDALELELKDLDPGNPFLVQVGFSNASVEKVSHQRRMLSLDKTYDEEELRKWIGTESVLSVFKIDGSSCSIVYEEGRLVLAKTRGDGSLGENITQKAIYIPDLPKAIPYSGTVEVRGEVYCVEKNFFALSKEMQELTLDAPTSKRNIVAGLLGRKENIQLCRYLSFKAFDLICDAKIVKEHQKLEFLKELGFDIPEFSLHGPGADLGPRITEAREFLGTGDYLIDGLVFVYDDIKLHQELGETSHHPRYKLAFKFAGETKSTKITGIEWGVSRNGRLTPVATIEPTLLSGATIGRVTLHNFGLVQSFRLKIGDTIEIIRSGEVIPKFLGVVEAASGDFTYPLTCPSCSAHLRIEDIWLLCENETCPSKVKDQILNYVQKVNIEDISEKRLEEMISKGLVKHIPDLYRLTKDDILLLEKVKEKLATKMYENIQKTRRQPLAQFISAVGVEGVSVAKSEKIIAHGHNTLAKIMGLTVEELVSIDGFAEKSSEAIIGSLRSKVPLMEELLAVGVVVAADEVSTGEGPLKGMKFCITGELELPRAQVEKLIKQSGGVIASVSKNLTFLVTNEVDGTSSKFIKAKALGIPIINEHELQRMLKG